VVDDPRLRAQRVAELLLQKTLSDEEMDELACLLAVSFGFTGEFRKFIRHLKDYEMSEEEEAAEHTQLKGVKDLWLREHPEDRDRKMWTREDDQRMRELWKKSRN
jgi:hypothetical protein